MIIAMSSPNDPPDRVDVDRDGPLRAAVTRLSSTLPATGHPTVAVRDPVRLAFHAWWSAESQYSLALDLYRADDSTGSEVREAALLLARLRARADSRRDMYFRAALS
jgi:hypothetical protein